ncbi:MAG: hypothetical protein WC528_05035 [Patescibacteria group bacterium]
MKKLLCFVAFIVISMGFFAVQAEGAQAATGPTSLYFGKMYTGDGGQANEAYLDMPKGFTFGPNNELYIADTANNVIRKIDKNGIISTYAGGGEYGNFDTTRLEATFSEPEGITYDGHGNYYIADTGSSLIRRIRNDIVVSLYVPGISRPDAIIVSGNYLYISDTGNNRVVKTSIYGGIPEVLAADLNGPLKISYHNGLLYVAENSSGKILSINVTTKAKTTLASGFTEPRAVFYYKNYLYVTAGPSGMYNEIWRINPRSGSKSMLIRRVETELLNQSSDMLIGTWAGRVRILMLQSGGSSIQTTDLSGQDLQKIAGRHRYGDETGVPSLSLLGRPQELVTSPDGTKIYIAYAQGNKIAEYNLLNQEVRVVAGFLMDNYKEGTGTDARFSDVVSMAINPKGTKLYVADRNSQRIRSVDIATGTTHYLTGAGVINLINPDTGNIDVNLDNGYQEGGPCPDEYDWGASACAYFNRPTGIAINKNGDTLFIADSNNQRIRKIKIATGQTSLIAGSGSKGFVNGVGAAASFNGPYTLTLSADEKNLYVVDKGNNAVRAINLADNRVTTLVGTGQLGYREGSFATAVLAIPEYIELGPDNNLYISEAGSLRVRKLDLSRQETSLVSGSGFRGKRDGSGEVSEWHAPKGMAFLNDKLLVADFKNDLLRLINLSGQVPTLSNLVVNKAEHQFFAFDQNWRSGFSTSAGEVNGDGDQEIVVGSGSNYPPLVRIFDLNGSILNEFYAYADNVRTGVKVAVCDLNSDGKSEIVTAPGKGSPPHIRIFNSGGQVTGQFFALDGRFRGGVSLACGDMTGDGVAEIAVAALTGGGPHVTVHNAGGQLIGNFMAYGRGFRGGIELGLADIEPDGVKEILTVPHVGKAHIQVFTGKGRRLSPGFFALDLSYNIGGTVAGGDVDGDGDDEILFSPGTGMSNEIRIFTRQGIRAGIVRSFPPAVQGYLSIYGQDVDEDGQDELVVMPESYGGPQLRVINIL